MALRIRNAAMLAKIESVAGTYEAPSASTDGILVENPVWQILQNNIETNEVTGSLDPASDIPAGGTVQVTFDVYLKGSGAAGTAPEFGKLLKACGWTETAQAVAIGPEPATAGTTSSATLDDTASPFNSATDDAYLGMPINIYDGTVLTNQSVCTGWNASSQVLSFADVLGGAIDTDNEIEIPAHVLYKPQSGTIPALSLAFYVDGLLHKMAGCRGTFTLSMDAGGAGKFSFTMTGIFEGKTDTAVPTVTYPAFDVAKLVWRNNNDNAAFLMNGVRQGVRNFSLDNGNQLTNPGNPNEGEGFDLGEITRRTMAGSVNPRATLIATRDELTKYRNGTQTQICARAGVADGNRFSALIPAAQYTNYGYEDQEGIVGEALPFKATGQNSGAFLAFY